MIKPKTIGIQALAARWGCQPKQIIEAAIDGQIKLYFSLGYCTIADLPNPNPHHRLHMRPYQGSLQVDPSTLKDLLHTNEARHVKEAYTPEGAWVLVAPPAQELPPPLSGQAMQTRIQQITPSLNIKTDDLHAFTEDVDAHESVDSASNAPTVPAPAVPAVAESAPNLDHCLTTQQPESVVDNTSNETKPAPKAVPVTNLAGREAKPASARRSYSRKGWQQTAAFEYVVNVYASLGPATAKQLCAKLKKSATDDSALGVKHGVLYVLETGKPLADKTIENSLSAIRKASVASPRESHFPAKHSRE